MRITVIVSSIKRLRFKVATYLRAPARSLVRTAYFEILQVKDRLFNWVARKAEKYSNKMLKRLILDVQGMPSCFDKYVDERIVDAIKLLIAKQEPMKIGDDHSYNWMAKLYAEGFLENASFEGEYVKKLESISEKGLLKVLLTVYLKLLPDFASNVKKRCAQKESLRIFDFVASLARLPRWSVNDVRFDGDLLHFVVVPVAVGYPSEVSVQKITSAFYFYAARIYEKYRNNKNIDAIFVTAIGTLNSLVAEKAAQLFHRRNSKQFEMRTKNNYEVLTRKGHKAVGTTIFLRRRTSLNQQKAETYP